MTKLRNNALCFLLLIGVSVNTFAAIDYRYYNVHGTTYHQLLDSLNNNGPNGFHAHTKWYVKWRWHYQKDGRQCSFKTTEVTLTTHIQFPKWVDYPKASTALQQKWTRYQHALMQHELGHARNGQLAKEAIEQLLKKAGSQSTCQELGRLSNQKAYAVLQQYKQADKQYDKTTQHGKTEGARF